MSYRFYVVFTYFVAIIIVAACSSPQEATGPIGHEPEGIRPIDIVTESDEPVRDAEPMAHDAPAKPENVNAMLHDVKEFSLDFYKRLSADNNDNNISFSPASLNMVMAVVHSGARGNTARQMSDVFGFSYDHDVFHRLYHAWYKEVMDITTDTLVEFDLANRVFLEESYPVLDDFQHDVSQWHGGAFEKMNFISNPRAAEERINGWVEDITRNRIRDIIPQGSLSELTRLVLVNAMYIKSDWKFPFDKERNEEKLFTAAGGEQINTVFMQQRQRDMLWYEQDDFIAMELPYATPELSLLLIRPNEEVVNDVSQYVPDADAYSAILEGLRPHEVHMEIPPFTIESEFSLVESLRQAGLTDVFSDKADLSGISGHRDLSVSSVLQKVFFEIDEEGSEAAAATAAVIVTTSLPVDPPDYQPKRFIANRPFLFILKENRHNTPLFIGQYVR